MSAPMIATVATVIAAATPNASPNASPTVTVVVDTATSTAFEHRWKRSFGSGHASLSLRKDWRAHLASARTSLGLGGVRYHGLFDDDNGPVVPAPGVYNWTSVDSTWDYLVAQDVHPIVELSFMPAYLANCSWHGHCKPDRLGCQGYWCTQCNGHGVGPIVNPSAPKCERLEFWFQGIKQTPYQHDYTQWHDLVRATAQHAIKRYGLAEVQSWSFEVWNELWGLSFPHDYMALYNASARALKGVHASLRVGGPATAALAHVADFVDQCEKGGIPYDFVSTHHYPTDHCPKGAAWDPDCFIKDVLASRASVAHKTPYYLTEYNVGCCLGYAGHDVSTAAAFVFRSVGALNSHLDVYSYWSFTDVFEEGGLPQLQFKNVYGAMSINGVPKPVWRAFELLHTHAGDRRLSVTISNQTTPSLDASLDGAHPLPPPTSSAGDAAAETLWAVAVPCNASDATQLGWSFTGGALRRDAAAAAGLPTYDKTTTAATLSLCIDSLGGPSALRLTSCVYLQPSQTFSRTKWTAYEQAGKCLDVYQPDTPSYRRVDLYRCNGGDNQQFALTAAGQLAAANAHDVRTFLSFWADPLANASTLPANRTVRLIVRHAPATAEARLAQAEEAEPAAPPATAATVYTIDDAHVHPAASWRAMGSPAKLTPSQLDALMAASEVHAQRAAVPVTRLNASCVEVEVHLAPNSAAVVAFE